MELADVLDESGQPTGQQKTKEAMFRNGDWRLVTHIWIVNPQTKQLLVQLRVKKGMFDELWDVSVGGGVKAGEPSNVAAQRETAEELGLKFSLEQFEIIGRFKIPKLIPEKQLMTNEYSDTYLVRSAVKATQLKLQKSEVDRVDFISLEKLRNKINNPKQYKLWLPHSPAYYNQVADLISEKL